jgi:hypothetical protein
MRCRKCGVLTFCAHGLCHHCYDEVVSEAAEEMNPTDIAVGFYDSEGFYHPSPAEEALFRHDMMEPQIFNPEDTDHIEIEFDDEAPF